METLLILAIMVAVGDLLGAARKASGGTMTVQVST
jgi:hypothetical protein